MDPDGAAADPAAHLHKAISAAAGSNSDGVSNMASAAVGINSTGVKNAVGVGESPVSRELPSLSARLAAIAAMRDTLCEGLWALHEERPADPLPFLMKKLQVQSDAKNFETQPDAQMQQAQQ